MKQRMQFYSMDLIWRMPLLLFLLVIYLCGTVIGAFTGIWGQDTQSVQQMITSILQDSAQTLPLLRRIAGALCSTMLWFLLCIISGLLVPSVLFCSAIIAVRGFLLSFSVAAMVVAMGAKGMLVSLATIGIGAIISVPCLLLTGTAVLETASSLKKGQRRRYFYELGRYRSAIFVCAMLSMLAAVLRAAAQPVLLQWIGMLKI